MSSRELTEWACFEREYGPLGPARGDWQAAVVAFWVACAAGAKPNSVSDFLPRWSTRGRRQTAEEQLALFRAMASVGGGDGSHSQPVDPPRG